MSSPATASKPPTAAVTSSRSTGSSSRAPASGSAATARVTSASTPTVRPIVGGDVVPAAASRSSSSARACAAASSSSRSCARRAARRSASRRASSRRARSAASWSAAPARPGTAPRSPRGGSRGRWRTPGRSRPRLGGRRAVVAPSHDLLLPRLVPDGFGGRRSADGDGEQPTRVGAGEHRGQADADEQRRRRPRTGALPSPSSAPCSAAVSTPSLDRNPANGGSAASESRPTTQAARVVHGARRPIEWMPRAASCPRGGRARRRRGTAAT